MKLTDIQDYLLPTERDDWDELLAPWAELVPESSSRWLLSRFGEVFLEQADGKIGMLQVSSFQYEVVADHKQDFEDWLADPEKMDEWFLAPLVDRLVSADKTLELGQCYSFITPLGLGGQVADDNVMMIPIKEHFLLFGDVFQQIKDLPDGSEVQLRITD